MLLESCCCSHAVAVLLLQSCCCNHACHAVGVLLLRSCCCSHAFSSHAVAVMLLQSCCCSHAVAVMLLLLLLQSCCCGCGCCCCCWCCRWCWYCCCCLCRRRHGRSRGGGRRRGGGGVMPHIASCALCTVHCVVVCGLSYMSSRGSLCGSRVVSRRVSCGRCQRASFCAEVAFEMLDENKEGLLGKKQAASALPRGKSSMSMFLTAKNRMGCTGMGCPGIGCPGCFHCMVCSQTPSCLLNPAIEKRGATVGQVEP